MSAGKRPGRVHLVGAGPGDPGLITVRGLEVLRQAEVVIYDRLVDPSLLRHAPPQAERIFAGKAPRGHALTQEAINDLLVEHAREGKVVCRLKGGDPFVFGRGGEEATVLREAGIPFEVVSGVTSAVAVPAAAGIPLTCRGLVTGVGIFTGHEQEDDEVEGPAPAPSPGQLQTLVYLMGVRRLPDITRALLAAGWDPATPAAVVESGTLPQQRTITATLATVAEAAQEAAVRPPAITVVGEVVRLREELRWFDSRPLFGRRVLVTRAREQSEGLAARLRELGAEAIEVPLIRIEAIPNPDLSMLDRPYDWMIFTSANAVRCLAGALEAGGRDARALPRAPIAAIGAATAAAVEQAGLRVALTPDEATAEGLLAALPADLAGQRVLLLRAREGRDELPDGLRGRGAAVEILPLYETVPDGTGAEAVRERFASGEIDAVLFSSPSTVRNFRSLLPEVSLQETKIVCIGPVTAAAAAQAGLPVTATADPPSDQGLADALVTALFPSNES